MKRNSKGQGLVEYGLIVALIAMIILGIMVNLGKGWGPKIKIFVLEKYRSNKQVSENKLPQ